MPALVQHENIATTGERQRPTDESPGTLRSLPDVPEMRVNLTDLHDAKTGRIDARKVADYMGVPLKRLAEGLRLNYKAVHRNPIAEATQGALQPVKRSLEILNLYFRKPELVRAWLNTPHPALDGKTALGAILDNEAGAVQIVLESALAGVPV